MIERGQKCIIATQIIKKCQSTNLIQCNANIIRDHYQDKESQELCKKCAKLKIIKSSKNIEHKSAGDSLNKRLTNLDNSDGIDNCDVIESNSDVQIVIDTSTRMLTADAIENGVRGGDYKGVCGCGLEAISNKAGVKR